MNGTRPNVVVDGSNIATEGRSRPSLAQLDEAVTTLVAEYDIETLTVIVDATFAHRVNKSERKAYEEALEAGELLTPPAGTVGRGDAFILQVAERADATVFSNDSFQEFHNDHPWLFEPDRLLGGKPIEGLGWIFIKRIPVRGPKGKGKPRSNTKATRSTRSRPKPATEAIASATAAAAQSTQKKQNKKPQKANKSRSPKQTTKTNTANVKPKTKAAKPSPSKRNKLNDSRSFLAFVTNYSIGDTARANVTRFISHGCYVQVADATCYLASRLMGDSPPKRARDLVNVGDELYVKVESYDANRRGINVSLASPPATKRQASKAASKPKNANTKRGRKRGGRKPKNPPDE